MNKVKHNDEVLKHALKQRTKGRLPSNFTYQMMERVHLEKKKQERRNKVRSILILAFTSLFLIVLTLYVLVVEMRIDLLNYIPLLSVSEPSPILTTFYGYIAVLALALLGFDYWLRSRKRKTSHK